MGAANHRFCAIHDYDLYDEAGYERKWADFDKLMKSTPSKRQVYTQVVNIKANL